MDGERRVEGEACVVLFPLLFLLRCVVLPLAGIMSDDGTRRTRTRAKETEEGGPPMWWRQQQEGMSDWWWCWTTRMMLNVCRTNQYEQWSFLPLTTCY